MLIIYRKSWKQILQKNWLQKWMSLFVHCGDYILLCYLFTWFFSICCSLLFHLIQVEYFNLVSRFCVYVWTKYHSFGDQNIKKRNLLLNNSDAFKQIALFHAIEISNEYRPLLIRLYRTAVKHHVGAGLL